MGRYCLAEVRRVGVLPPESGSAELGLFARDDTDAEAYRMGGTWCVTGRNLTQAPPLPRLRDQVSGLWGKMSDDD
jgi:hypothetical protein